MPANKIKTNRYTVTNLNYCNKQSKITNLNRVQVSKVQCITRLILLFSFSLQCNADELPPKVETVPPYQVPTFTGENTDWHTMKPAINPAKTVNADLIVETVNRCYPVPPMNIEISLRSGATYKPPSTGAMVQSLDASQYYAGIVATMPLYSGVEIDKEQKLAIDRKLKTVEAVAQMLTALSTKRRAERMLGLYLSLEKRSQKRVQDGIVSVDEQINALEKVATTQGELDSANATIEGSRLALIHQCKAEDVDRLNNFILSEIY